MMINKHSSKLDALRDLVLMIIDHENPVYTLRPEVLELGNILKAAGPELAYDGF